MSTEALALQLVGVRRSFVDQASGVEFPAVRGVDLGVRPGSMVAIIGASGSGKSTLLNLAGLLDRPTSGSVRLAGNDVDLADENQVCRLRSQHLGFVFQQFHLMNDRSVAENILLPFQYRPNQDSGPSDTRRAAESALELVDLGWAADLFPSALSGGERQRVAIARALVRGPDLLLCDEPTGQLDFENSTRVIALLRNLANQGFAVVIVTHDPEVSAAADDVYQMCDGELRRVSTAQPAPEDSALSLRTFASREGGQLEGGQREIWGLRQRLRTAWREGIASVLSRPSRAVLMTAGIAVCGGAVIATSGLSASAGLEVYSSFDAVSGTMVSAAPAPNDTGTASGPQPAEFQPGLPTNAVEQALQIDGVASVAGLSRRNSDQESVRVRSAASRSVSLPVVGSNGSGLGALGTSIDAGEYPAEEPTQLERAVVLGSAAAVQLGVDTTQIGDVLILRGRMLRILGILKPATRRPDLDVAVFMSTSQYQELFDVESLSELVVRTRVGATRQVAEQLALAVNPQNPDLVSVRASSDPQDLRNKVASSVGSMLVVLSVLSLVVSMLGIASMSLLSVGERSGEIGLRRAIGASRGDIALQFVVESALQGGIGGLAGGSVGGIVVLLVSLWKGWAPMLDLRWVLLAPLVGLLAGICAGLSPAHRAASIEPAEAVRGGV